MALPVLQELRELLLGQPSLASPRSDLLAEVIQHDLGRLRRFQNGEDDLRRDPKVRLEESLEHIASGLDQAVTASEPDDGCRARNSEARCPRLPSSQTIIQEHENRPRVLTSRDDG